MGDNVAPRFTQKPTLKQESGAILFNCEIEANPKPEVNWFHGTTPLKDSDRLQAKVENVAGSIKYKLILTLKNVTANDSGTYKVEAKNSFGQMSANINLNLQGICQRVICVYIIIMEYIYPCHICHYANMCKYGFDSAMSLFVWNISLFQ